MLLVQVNCVEGGLCKLHEHSLKGQYNDVGDTAAGIGEDLVGMTCKFPEAGKPQRPIIIDE